MILFYRLRFRLLVLSLLAVVPLLPARAGQGDTTRVEVFDEYLWTWNGGQNRWAIFPDSTKRYERILMHYRLKCPTGGCGEWDYTTNIYIMHHTGRIDSSLQAAPNFRVDGQIVDSIAYSMSPTVRYSYNTTTKKVDTTTSTQLKITLYEDPNDVWRQTDSMMVWPAGYYNPIFDENGDAIDSVYVQPDEVRHLMVTTVYVPFEVVVPYEIGRFITPYGKWFPKDMEFDWVFDVTDYAYLLRDSVEIRAFYDGWSQGSLFSLDFELIEGIPTVDVFRVENLYTGGFTYGDPNNPIEDRLVEKTITIDEDSKYTRLKLVTSGHGFGGTDNAAEFSDKTHWVEVNGMRRFDQHLWRSDCGQNPVYPQAGTWYYNRAGWCPGDIVHPFIYDLTPHVSPGGEATIDYEMQPYTNADPSKPATYIIQAQVLYAGEPNFTNDVRLEEIRRPNSGYMYRRMNPICSNDEPVIVVRNTGKNDLTSLKVSYGIDGEASRSYTWSGRVKFMDTAVIMLPGIELGSGVSPFTATLIEPNGLADEYPSNNSMSVPYAIPQTSSGVIYLTLRADDFLDDPQITNGISYEVVDLAGRVLYQNGGFADRAIVRDTFRLHNGCYNFIIRDNYFGDGLIPIRGTAGSYLLKDNQNKTIINGAAAGPLFLASFGDREVIPFVVTGSSSVNDAPSQESGELRVYPNPTGGSVTLELPSSLHGRSATVQLYSANGEEVMSRTFASAAPQRLTLDLSEQGAGVYMVKVSAGDVVWGEKIVVEKR